jgi:hypothetical protein
VQPGLTGGIDGRDGSRVGVGNVVRVSGGRRPGIEVRVGGEVWIVRTSDCVVRGKALLRHGGQHHQNDPMGT